MGHAYVMRVRRYPPDLTLAGMDVAIGLIHILSAPARSSAPAFSVARDLAHRAVPYSAHPMWIWGVAFLAVGALLAVAVVEVHAVGRRSRAAFWVRTLGPALYVMWAGMYLLAGLHDDRASLLGIPPYVYLAWRHYYAPASPAR